MATQQIEKSPPLGPEGKHQILTVHSSHLKGRGSISVYNAFSEKKDLPIVVLMHGVWGGHWVIMNLGGIHEVYDRMVKASEIEEFVLVMPEDGSYFGGSAYLPLENGFNFDAWIVEDVLNTVKEQVNCISENSNTYITGLSMGGYGALRLASKHCDLFKGATGHSSITDFSEMKHFVKEGPEYYPCSEQEKSILYWMKKNRNSLPPMQMDCGKDDILYSGNRKFKEELDKHEFNIDLFEHEGGHEWPYWNEHFAESFAFFDKIEKSLK